MYFQCENHSILQRQKLLDSTKIIEMFGEFLNKIHFEIYLDFTLFDNDFQFQIFK